MENKTCQNCKKDFTIDEADFGFYEQMKVPPPTWCPDCRLQRRLSFRNDRSLYKITCALCKKDTFSTVAPGGPYTVYCMKCAYSDEWDPSSYGREYDFSKSFFQQFKELFANVPMRALFISDSMERLVNSEYTNMVSNLKNCYLIYNSDYSESCQYGTEIESCKDCVDGIMIDSCESSYSCVNCQKCYRAFHCVDCEASSDIWFSRNLSGCQNCFGCVNLRNKNYYIFNEPYSKEEYLEKLEELKKDLPAAAVKAAEHALNYPMKFMRGKQNTNVSGDYIHHSKDTLKTYIATEAQNCKYCMWLLVKPTKDCWDYTEYGDNAERMYEVMSGGNNVSDIKLSNLVSRNSARITYSSDCFTQSDSFGCVGMRKRQYCILNKQYSKEEYEALVPKIIAHMDEMPYADSKGRVYKYGEFFPVELSRYAYNETNAQEYFPLTKEQALAQGFRWKDCEEKAYNPNKSWKDLSQTIEGVTEAVLNDTILCQAWDEDSLKAQEHRCTKAFKITKYEFEFYKKFGLPLPRKCPNSRYFDLSKMRAPIALHKRSCQCLGGQSEGGGYTNLSVHFHNEEKCPNEFETTYAPDRPEVIYCEACYQQEVV